MEYLKEEGKLLAISAIFVFYLGRVRDLRDTFKIGPQYADNDNVMSYGKTTDLNQCIHEYKDIYGKVKGIDLRLRKYIISNKSRLSFNKKLIKLIVKDYVIDTVTNVIVVSHRKTDEIMACMNNLLLSNGHGKLVNAIAIINNHQQIQHEISIIKLESDRDILAFRTKTHAQLIESKDKQLTVQATVHAQLIESKDKQLTDQAKAHAQLIESKDKQIALLEMMVRQLGGNTEQAAPPPAIARKPQPVKRATAKTN